MAFKKGDKKPANSGKKKGTMNKVSASLKEMILASLDEVGGQAYLVEQAKNNPNAYITLIGKVLPTTLASDKDNPINVPVFQLIVSKEGKCISKN